jgi:hypothetical protein
MTGIVIANRKLDCNVVKLDVDSISQIYDDGFVYEVGFSAINYFEDFDKCQHVQYHLFKVCCCMC